MQRTSVIALALFLTVPTWGQVITIDQAPNTPVLMGPGDPAPLEVQFSNLAGSTVDAPIFNFDGVPLAGVGYHVELCYDASPILGDPQSVAGPSATFKIGGYFLDKTRTIFGFEVGDQVTVWVRAWAGDAASTFAAATLRGESNQFPLTVPGQVPPPLPALMADLESFSLQIVPEPGALAIGTLLGLVAWGVVLVGRKRA